MNVSSVRHIIIAAAIAVMSCGMVTSFAQAPATSIMTPAVPSWAYPVATRGPRPAGAARPNPTDDDTPRHVPGSTKTYTSAQVLDLFDIPDWFPDDHPKMPPSVGVGRKPDAVPCGYCHLPNGLGRPENQSVAGLQKEYIIQQVKEFASGARKSSEPHMGSVNYMVRIAKAVTPEEMAEAADYFSKVKLTKWIRVVETDTVPKTHISGGMLIADEGTEPIGSRIIEVSENLEQTELRNDRSGFIAYVPKGSLKIGQALVKTGGNGKTMPCSMCHGADLKGQANVPGIVGRSPSQLTRQMIDFRNGSRDGSQAAMMKMAVAKLTEDDIAAITGYLASLEP